MPQDIVDGRRNHGRSGSRVLLVLALAACVWVCLWAAAPAARAQEDQPANAAARASADQPRSFASAFFISRVTDPNGQTHIDIVGSVTLWLLLALSVMSVGLIGMTAMANQRASFMPASAFDKVRSLLGAGRFRETIEFTATDPSFFSQALNAALRLAPHGVPAMAQGLQQAAEELATSRLRRIEHLNVLAQVSPMIGLFGTVWGMILAFHSIVAAGGNADPVLLAGGIGTALTTTFWGLIIAIPALAAYAVIRNRVDEFTMQALRAAEELLKEFKPRPAAAAAPRPSTPHAAAVQQSE